MDRKTIDMTNSGWSFLMKLICWNKLWSNLSQYYIRKGLFSMMHGKGLVYESFN